MPHVQATQPENDVFRDVGCMVSDALEVPRGQGKLEIGSDMYWALSHSGEEVLEDLISIPVYDVVTLKDLAGQHHIAEYERPQTLVNDRAHGCHHRSELWRPFDRWHLRQRDYTLSDIQRQIAHALEVIGYLEGGDS